MKVLSKHWGKLATATTVLGTIWYASTREEDKVAVSVVPVHYLPHQQRIEDFYVNSRNYSSSSFEGTAVLGVCCVVIPASWHAGMEVDISWVVSDWSQAQFNDEEKFDRKKIKLVGIYRTKVPVERYKEAGDLYVHFFDGGRVRVAPGVPQLSDPFRSKPSIETAAKIATQGRRVQKAFTTEDMAKIDREIEADEKRNGDWR